jgi:hypothetical protein
MDRGARYDGAGGIAYGAFNGTGATLREGARAEHRNGKSNPQYDRESSYIPIAKRLRPMAG